MSWRRLNSSLVGFGQSLRMGTNSRLVDVGGWEKDIGMVLGWGIGISAIYVVCNLKLQTWALSPMS